MTPFETTILGIKILEPITLMSDTALAMLCIFLFFKIKKMNGKTHLAKNWRNFFLWFGVSTFIAAIGHGFMNYIGKNLLVASWVLAGIMPYYNQAASITRISQKKNRKILAYLILFELLIVSFLVIFIQDFIFVTINSVLALAGMVLFIRVRDVIITKNRNSKYIIVAIGIGFLAAITHTLHISISAWFNHKDLSHVILMVSTYFFFLGAKGEVLVKEEKIIEKKSDLDLAKAVAV